MQPGENRWIGLTFAPPRGKDGEVLPVHFFEIVDRTIVNGFAVGARLSAIPGVIRETLSLYRSILTRLAAGFGMAECEEAAAEVRRLLDDRRVSEAVYVRLMRDRSHFVEATVRRLLRDQRAGDAFRVAAAARVLVGYLKAGRADAVAVAHTALLNKLDAFLTMLQLARGDPADILQNVRWQQRLYAVVPALARLRSTSMLLEQSDRFIRGYGERRVRNNDYPALIGSLRPSFEETARSAATRRLRLAAHLAEMERSLGDPTALQRAHRGFLLKLQALARA
jgi:hypothetical protein